MDYQCESDEKRDERILFVSTIPEVSGIYKIKFHPLELSYIGASKNIRRRCADHFRNMSISILHNRMSYFYKKYGIDCFSVEVLEECDGPETLPILEQLFIDRALSKGEMLWNYEFGSKKHRDWY